MSPALRAARDQWYTRLAREGFRDVEMRRGKGGWYETPAYTYEHGEASLGDETEVATSVWELPTAVHFSKVADALEALPLNGKWGTRLCRGLLKRYLESGNLLRSAEALGLSRQQGRTMLKHALEMLRERTGGDDGEAVDQEVRARRPVAAAAVVRAHQQK